METPWTSLEKGAPPMPVIQRLRAWLAYRLRRWL